VKAGSILKYDKLTAYSQLIYDMKAKPEDQAQWSLGLQKSLSDVSSATFYLRHDYSVSLLYNLDFPKNKVNGQVCCNAQFGKPPSLEWKLTLSP